MTALLESDHPFNDTINSFVIDFVTYNGDLNYFTYIALSFRFDSSGNIEWQVHIWPMRLDMYSTGSDISRAFTECVFLALLLWHMWVTFASLYKDWKHYSAWKITVYSLLTPNQITRRNIRKPEFLRRLSNLLTPFILIDLFSYTCLWISIVYWVSYLNGKVRDIELKTDEESFHDYFNAQAGYLESYLFWSSFSLLFIFLRMLNFLSIRKGLRFLQNTLSSSAIDIFYFILMLLVIMMGFVFMAYLCFGHSLEHYQSIHFSFMTCFSIIIGEFEYTELSETDPLMAVLFFFAFAIFMTYVLLNIFIAILERAFNRVKQREEESSSTNYLKVLLTVIIRNVKGLIRKEKGEAEQPEKEISTKVKTFNNIEAELDICGDQKPEEWARNQVSSVLAEKEERKSIFEPLNEVHSNRKQREIEENKYGFQDTSDALYKEIEARKQYWNYLRENSLSFRAQEKRIIKETKHLSKQELKLSEKYNEYNLLFEGIAQNVVHLSQKLDNLNETKRNQ